MSGLFNLGKGSSFTLVISQDDDYQDNIDRINAQHSDYEEIDPALVEEIGWYDAMGRAAGETSASGSSAPAASGKIRACFSVALVIFLCLCCLVFYLDYVVGGGL